MTKAVLFLPFLLFIAGSFLGCFSRTHIKPPGDPTIGLRVQWYGHSCFLVEDSAGRTFLIDPFNDSVGYALSWPKTDATLITHDHFDHNYLFQKGISRPARSSSRRHASRENSQNRPSRSLKAQRQVVVASTGTHIVAGIEVLGLSADHDNEGGRRHGKTNIYIWRMGGLTLAHLGDIGQETLSSAQVQKLQDIDILFIPVGGQTTVDAEAAAALVKTISPRVVVPMHYGHEQVRFYDFDPVDLFLKHFSDVVKWPQSMFHIRQADLPKKLTIYVPKVAE